MFRRAVAMLAMLAAPALADPVRVDGGLIDGKDLGHGVRGWFGVPFAAPPVRDLRWKPPQPVVAWDGVFHADRFAPMCLQSLRARTMNHYFGNEATSEDCLYLNAWAPGDARPGARLPVIVWIYGGAFNVGSASMANYAGANLARDGVVYVSIAYRVGPLGFLAHPGLTAEGGGHSGNYGLMDQVAALQWVQRNVAAFGGDPANVTVMGQSAGSMSVSLLQIDPGAKGLFARLAGMSGSAHGRMLTPVPLARAEAQGVALQQALGVGSVEAMRDLPGDRVLAVAAGVPRDPIVIDGVHITGTAPEVFAAHRQNDVPVLIGFTRDERFASLGPASTVAGYRAVLARTFGARAGAIFAAYPAQADADVGRALVDVMRDMSVGSQMFNWAGANAAHGTQPAFAYHFTRRQPYAAGITFSDHDPATAGAYHSGEVPYFLRNLDSLNLFRKTRDWGEPDYRLRDTMSGMILSFARSGRPAPGWPAFDPQAPKVMLLGDTVKVAEWPNWKALPLLADPVATQPGLPAAGGARPRD
ncbi:MAG: carboxylesterase family protein [Sphingomonadales bacterium]|nr:carboxylesterase family protein [Sphingomonadales bacterium]